MQPSRVPFVLALVTFALALVSGAYLYHAVVRSVPAVVPVRDIPAGTAITPEMVDVVRVPAGGTPPAALWGPGQVAGKYAAVPLLKGHLLSQRQLTETPGGAPGATGGLAPDQRLVPVPIRPEAVPGGALRPGDMVDVVAAWPAPGSDTQPTARRGVDVLLPAVRVVDVRNSLGQSLADGAAADGGAPASVLLQVSTAQAARLVEAMESRATLYLWLLGRDAK